MLKIIWKAFKILAVLILAALAGFAFYYLAKPQGWPWWTSIVAVAGLIALIAAFIFIKKYLFRRREERFVKRIVEQDASIIQRKPLDERQALLDLQERWKEAVNILRRSHLKKHGNPLYVLPWYLVMGESGAGKTTAIKNAGLLSPLTDVGPAKAIGVTQNCDWWFFDRAVVLDTAGRYVVPLDEGPDREEWKRFLTLLSKYRRREPINGAVVAMPADKLISEKVENLIQEARTLRRSLDELMRVLGAKFPVYVLITKADRILGLADFGEKLPAELLEQAMGRINTSDRNDPEAFVGEAVESVSDRLKDIRLFLLEQTSDPEPGLLLFPDELERLRPRLGLFVRTIFEQNPYQETPFLRGLYISSGRQEGRAFSQMAEAVKALPDIGRDIPGREKSYFLADFFSNILPADRNLFAPIREFISWRRLTQSLALTAWTAFILCVCGVLTLSYLENRETVADFTEDFAKAPDLTGDLGRNLLMMGRLKSEILAMEDRNSRWWIPRLGLTHSLEAERELKTRFCDMFRKGFLERLDQGLVKQIGAMNAKTSKEVVGAFAEHLESRINLLVAALNGASLKELQNHPSPAYSAMVIVDDRLIPQIAVQFSDLYLAYLDWNLEPEELNRELSSLRVWIDRLSETQGGSLDWLVAWANVQAELKPVTLQEFWGDYLASAKGATEVAPAFTTAGRKMIDDLMKQYGAALGNPAGFSDRAATFDKTYWREYVLAWEKFGKAFAEGFLTIKNHDDMRALAQIMADLKNPYFTLIEKMSEELEPAAAQGGAPAWAQMAVSFRQVRDQARQADVMEASGILGKAAEKGKEALGKAAAVIPAEKDAMKRMEQVIKDSDLFRAYEKALSDIIPVTSSREKAYKMGVELFQAEGAAGKAGTSPFRDAYSAFVGYRNTVKQQEDRDNLFWRLYSGPLYFLLAYTLEEVGCELQTGWEGNVLAEVKDMPPEKFREALFEKDKGLVWKFIYGPVAPFLKRDLKGFSLREALGQKLAMNKDFLKFLDDGTAVSGIALPEYAVTIRSVPIGVNREATLGPFASVLIMDCADGSQQLENFNYPSRQVFKWKTDKCGRVTLRIRFQDFTLTKTYEGGDGFPRFLEAFQDGVEVFKPADFPDSEKVLTRLGVTEIRVSFRIEGAAEVMRLHKAAPILIPLAMTRCWGP